VLKGFNFTLNSPAVQITARHDSLAGFDAKNAIIKDDIQMLLA
jgi:hypothetical protein